MRVEADGFADGFNHFWPESRNEEPPGVTSAEACACSRKSQKALRACLTLWPADADVEREVWLGGGETVF